MTVREREIERKKTDGKGCGKSKERGDEERQNKCDELYIVRKRVIVSVQAE